MSLQPRLKKAGHDREVDACRLDREKRLRGAVFDNRTNLADAQAKGVATPDHRYVSVYDVDTDDLQGALDALLRSARNLDMGDSLDLSTASAVLWEEITPRVAATGV